MRIGRIPDQEFDRLPEWVREGLAVLFSEGGHTLALSVEFRKVAVGSEIPLYEWSGTSWSPRSS